MEFELSPEQQQVRDLVREFATQEIAPGAGERDEREELPLDIVKKLGELGICGVPIPEAYGGLGADAVTWALVIEELGRADASVAVTVSVATGTRRRHDRPIRDRCAATAVAPAHRRRRDARRVRVDGAGERIRCRRAPDEGPARTAGTG